MPATFVENIDDCFKVDSYSRETELQRYPLVHLTRAKPVNGDIGIEIEMEGNKFPKTNIVAPWTYHKDGSLRGQDNAEYVLNGPIAFSSVPKALDSLWNMLKEYGTELDDSNRTSVHVHLNVQKFHLNRLCAFLGMYFSVEELLVQWCGDYRVGNLFCLRAKDAPAIVSRVKKFIQSSCQKPLTDNFHYAGVNAHAISKYGSLEIRSLRGVTSPEPILQWVSILKHIYDLSATFKDPRDVPCLLSSKGAFAYLDTVIGADNAKVVLSNIPYDQDQVRNALYDGIRLAQDICYCMDWDNFTPITMKEDPFGRASKAIPDLTELLHQIQAYSTVQVPSFHVDWNGNEAEDDEDNDFVPDDYIDEEETPDDF